MVEWTTVCVEPFAFNAVALANPNAAISNQDKLVGVRMCGFVCNPSDCLVQMKAPIMQTFGLAG